MNHPLNVLKERTTELAHHKLYLVKLLWCGLCICGSILQMIQVSIIYFSYRVTSVVVIDFPDKMVRPSLTICFDSIDFYKWATLSPERNVSLLKAGFDPPHSFWLTKYKRKLQGYVDKLDLNERIKYSGILFSGMNAHEIVDNLTGLATFLDGCFQVSNTDYKLNRVNCSASYIPKAYVRDMETCVELDSNLPSDEYSFVELRQVSTEALLFKFILKVDLGHKGTKFRYSLAGRHRFLRNGFIKPVSTLTNSYGSTLTYDVFTNELLKLPYETDCLDYDHLTGEVLTSRGDCFEFCVAKLSMDRWKKLLPGVSVGENSKSVIITQYELDNDPKMNREAQVLIDWCNQGCHKPECNWTIYSVRIQDVETVFTSTALVHSVKVDAMQSPTVTTQAVPNLSFIEYRRESPSTGTKMPQAQMPLDNLCWPPSSTLK